MNIPIHTLAQTTALAEQFAESFTPPCVVYLIGELGAGKTTFTKAVFSALGVRETVKSPTFSILEAYQLDQYSLLHMDLYRIQSPEEISFLGLEDLLTKPSILLIEWPEHVDQAIPKADISIKIEFEQKHRVYKISAHSEIGRAICDKLDQYDVDSQDVS